MQQNLAVFNIEYEWLIPVFIGIAMFTLAFMFLRYVVLSPKDMDDDEDENENNKAK